MAQSRTSRSRSTSSGKPGASNQLILIELNQRILAAINKLADRDTQHIAVDDLEHIAESLTPEGISVFLSCLYDTDPQQKSAVRKESVRLFGTLASLHDDLLAPHLSKIVANVVRRLKDPDSSIRDACVDTMGSLASRVLPPVYLAGTTGGTESGGSAPFAGPLGIFFKPLFDALSEQNRGVQVGAAMCLARVIESIKDPPPNALQRLCPRIAKYLSSSNFTAKAALLSVIGSVLQAGGAASYQCLAMFVTCVEEALKSTDWATRKAASETLLSMASSTGSSLGSFKSTIMEALESCRFDKVKPVRDSVVHTLQVWKSIPACKSDLIAPDRMSSVKENAFIEGSDICLPVRKIDAYAEAVPVLTHLVSVNSSNQRLDSSCGFGQAKSAGNKISGSNQKRRTPLSDKKTNPDFFRKTEKKDSIWQVEVAVPCTSVPAVQEGLESHLSKTQGAVLCRERRVSHESSGAKCASSVGDVIVGQQNSESVKRSEPLEGFQSMGIMIQNQVFEENAGMGSAKSRMSKPRLTKTQTLLDQSLLRHGEGVGSWTAGTTTSSSSSSGFQVTSSDNDLACIRRQLCQIELQQSNLLKLLQGFMSSSEESLHGLEARVCGMENVVEHLTQDITSVKCEGGSARCCGKLLPSADFLSSKFWKRNERGGSCLDRAFPSEAVSAELKVGKASSGKTEMGAETYEELSHGRAARNSLTGDQCLESQADTWRVHVDVSSEHHQRRTRKEFGGGLHANKKIWDRAKGVSRLGEGPSARSIWQASKDEATLTAIRVAGEDGRVKAADNLKAPAGLSHSTADMTLEGLGLKIGGLGKGPFWSLWTRAVEFLRSGDVDSAYIEVLCAGDELLLVRLMSRTGPVLEQLSSGTAMELLSTIIQLLLQQSFLDVTLPWIQQVVDLATVTGPECLGFSIDAKRELVASLQQASTLEFPESWIGKTLDELALQLANVWCIVFQRTLHG